MTLEATEERLPEAKEVAQTTAVSAEGHELAPSGAVALCIIVLSPAGRQGRIPRSCWRIGGYFWKVTKGVDSRSAHGAPRVRF